MKINDDDYIVFWQGAKLTKRQGNVVGLTTIFGILGSVLSALTIGISNKIAGSLIVFLFTLAGFLLGNHVFKK